MANYSNSVVPKCACSWNSDTTLYHTSEWLYNGRDFGPVWYCRKCQQSVGARKDGTPHGRMAGPETKRLRQAAHRAFDPLWQAKARYTGMDVKDARSAGYKWLAETLGVEREECHIALLPDADLERVIEICHQTGYWQRRRRRR